uniref:Uncharacterized protein n=1 Tax=Anguilla anguilla TaxID=7936 RepID=A0A0E9TNL4_ANGAN
MGNVLGRLMGQIDAWFRETSLSSNVPHLKSSCCT